MLSQAVIDLISHRLQGSEKSACLVVSGEACPTSLANTRDLVWLSNVRTASDLDDLPRQPMAIVCALPDSMQKRSVVPLLARLRDCCADRVLVYDETRRFVPAEMLALGFVETASLQNGGCVYLHDPDEFFERRGWNNARDWANPENFSKYRW